MYVFMRKRLRYWPMPWFARRYEISAMKAGLPYFRSAIRLPHGLNRIELERGYIFGAFINLCQL